MILVRQLRAAGANVFQHADLDAGGRGITAWLADLAGQRPVAHGHGRLPRHVATSQPRVALAGRLPLAPWDPRLVGTMAAHGVAVYEEEVRAGLLASMTG